MRYESFTPPATTNAKPATPELDATGYLPGRRPTAPPAPATANPSGALAAALDRLESLIDDETAALASDSRFDLAEMNRLKSQSLLEITRLTRSLGPGEIGPLQPRLGRLRDRLFTNHRLLGFHLKAAREVSDLMVGVLSEADSDGTYGPGHARRGRRP